MSLIKAHAIIRKLQPAEANRVRKAAAWTSMIAGGVAYFNYRERIRKEFLRSEAWYRFSMQCQNMTPWK